VGMMTQEEEKEKERERRKGGKGGNGREERERERERKTPITCNLTRMESGDNKCSYYVIFRAKTFYFKGND
jgi:hypothetical protein